MLNINNVGRPIANITNKKKNHILSVDPNFLTNKNNEGKDQINLTEKHLYEHLPHETESQVLYICGARGSGKSRYTKNYVNKYIKMFQKNRVFLFSQKKEDVELDSIKKLKRISLDDSLYEDPIKYEDLHDSLVIFDDVDRIYDVNIKRALKQLQDEIIDLGRSLNISIVITSHDLTDGKRTKTILGSTDTITFFPHSGAKYQMEYLCEKYGNLNKKDLPRIKKTYSRWCTIFRSYPNIILTEKEAFIPS